MSSFSQYYGQKDCFLPRGREVFAAASDILDGCLKWHAKSAWMFLGLIRVNSAVPGGPSLQPTHPRPPVFS